MPPVAKIEITERNEGVEDQFCLFLLLSVSHIAQQFLSSAPPLPSYIQEKKRGANNVDRM